jgi:transketolase
VELRAAYCNALMEAAKKDQRIITIDCDMRASMGTKAFAAAFPDRAFNLGIQEANACGMAAGLSSVGFVPFLQTFSVFVSRRLYDQAFLSCGYAGQNVKLVGGDAGISTSTNGGTHMPFEDIGIMRCIPGITIIEPADACAMTALLPQIAAHTGLVYMRMQRRKAKTIYAAGTEIQLGRANVLRAGNDAAIITCGMLVSEALLAAEKLAERGVQARVVDMHTIKPLDAECVLACARETGAVITAENHNRMGGLGDSVAACLARTCPTPMEMVGVDEQFGEVGSVDYLMERFGLGADSIVQKTLACIARKK